MFHRKFILSITITRFETFQPIIHVNSIFLIRAQFRSTRILSTLWSTFLLCPLPRIYIFYLTTRLCKLAFKSEIYPQGEILTETSRLGTIPRLCSTMPQEPRQPPRSAIKAKVTVYLPRKKISSLDETNAYDRLVKKWNRCELHSWITEIATLVTWDSSKGFSLFFFFFFWFPRALE